MSNKRSKPSTSFRVLGAAFYLLFCAFALGAGVAGWMIYESPVLGKVIWRTYIQPKKAIDMFPSGSVTVLILGCDEDLAPGGKKVLRANARSDMMLVAKLDFAHNRIGGVSIPRDLEVQLPGYRSQKINAYHAIGGNDLAKQAAEQVVGVSIDRVVQLNYDAFQELVNIVGGVDVYIPKNMKYTDRAGGLFIDFKKGRQHLNGYQAMCFVRFRHSDSDFKRMERQRDFMLALKDGIKSNPGLIGRFAKKSLEMAGGGFSEDEMIALAQFAQKVPGDSIKMSNLPTLPGRGTNLDIDESKVAKVLEDSYLTVSTSSAQRVTLQ